ncbi:hypothetical protein MPSEU_000815100 [Mayamaea pseudoterrestris]|nr:hypothetical protein MPSEU_000815100 [Mayamaea pseudoterrestris]
MKRPIKMFSGLWCLLFCLSFSSISADEDVANVRSSLDEATQLGSCDDAVTSKYAEMMQDMEIQHAQQLEESQATCSSDMQRHLSASQESVQEYKELAEQAQTQQQELQNQLEAANRQAEEQKNQLEQEMQTLSTRYNELQGSHANVAAELESARASLTLSRDKLAETQTELDNVRQEFEVIRNQYFNRQLFHRWCQEHKDAVESFYRNKVLPFLRSTKETILHVYQQITTKYHELCVALEPVWDAIVKVSKQAYAHLHAGWQTVSTKTAPHVDQARAIFHEKAGPHLAVASEKVGHYKSQASQALQNSPVYPVYLKGMDLLTLVQKHIVGGLSHAATGVLTLLEQHAEKVPEKLVVGVSYVKEHSTNVAVYLEGSIATLLVILILNSAFGGGGRAHRRVMANGYPTKSKVKKA